MRFNIPLEQEPKVQITYDVGNDGGMGYRYTKNTLQFMRRIPLLLQLLLLLPLLLQ